MRANDWGDVAALVFVLALVLVLVRPGSRAPALIAAVGSAFAKVIAFATDNTTGPQAGAALGGLG